MKSLTLLATMVLAASALAADPAEYWAFLGTYTGPKSKGIYAARFDTRTGKLGKPQLAGVMINPSFLAVHPNKHFLYAIGEGGGPGKKAGTVASFVIDASNGTLTPMNQQSSGGPGPCHVSVDPSGKCVLAANYGGGSVTAVPINADGSLAAPSAFIQHPAGSGVVKGRQETPHGHCIITDPENKFALACDLGLDKVLIYKFDASKGTLVANDPAFGATAPGAGPRHIAFHPNGKFAYVINELDCTMTTFAWDSARGALASVQSLSTLPGEKEKGFSTAEVQVHPSGKFVYGSNRGHDSISVFKVDESTGKLTRIQTESSQGKAPRHFTLDPTGRYIIAEHQSSDNVVVFAVDEATGRIKPTGDQIEVGSPVCAVFVPVR